jgi:hypothetical protein
MERYPTIRRIGLKFKNKLFGKPDISKGDIDRAQEAVSFAGKSAPSVITVNDKLVDSLEVSGHVSDLLNNARPGAKRVSRRGAMRYATAAGIGAAAVELTRLITDKTEVLTDEVRKLSQGLKEAEQEKDRVTGEFTEFKRRTEEDQKIANLKIDEANIRAQMETERADRLQSKADKFDQKTAAARKEEELLGLKDISPDSFNGWHLEKIPDAEQDLYSPSGANLFSPLSETKEFVFKGRGLVSRIGGAIDSERTQDNTGIYLGQRINSNLDEDFIITVATERGTGGPINGKSYVFTPGQRRLVKFVDRQKRAESLELLDPEPNDPTKSPRVVLHQKRI